MEDEASSTSGGMENVGYKHPKTVATHLIFKTLALLLYIFGRIFTSSFVLLFVGVTLLLSLDFWAVKNVTGRLLVGLRWWNKVAEDGSTEWVFESKKGKAPHPGEARIFWWSLYIYTVFWVALALSALVRLAFGYFLLVVVAISLNISNVIGYWKCDKDAKRKIAEAAASFAGTYGPDLLGKAASLLSNSTSAGARGSAG